MHGDHNLETSWRALVVWRYWLYLRKIVKHRADQYWCVLDIQYYLFMSQNFVCMSEHVAA